MFWTCDFFIRMERVQLLYSCYVVVSSVIRNLLVVPNIQWLYTVSYVLYFKFYQKEVQSQFEPKIRFNGHGIPTTIALLSTMSKKRKTSLQPTDGQAVARGRPVKKYSIKDAVDLVSSSLQKPALKLCHCDRDIGATSNRFLTSQFLQPTLILYHDNFAPSRS